MTNYQWATIRDQAIEMFGETPSAQLEADIIEHFEHRPAHVADLIQQIATKVADGKVRSGWAVTRADLNRPTPNPTATDTNERQKRITNAKTWIDNAGLHYDRRDHIEAELFGDTYSRGRLDAYKTDPELRTELLDYWQQQRPRGERAEQDHEDWNAKCKADREVMLAIKAKQQAEHKARFSLPKPHRLTDEEYFEPDKRKPTPATTSPDINFDT